MEHSFLNRIPIAHRGLHQGCPENSLPAFEAAIQAGYAIETDVRLTKDHKLVIFHDDTLTRMTGVEKRVIDCTYEELCTYRLEGSDEIPLFTDFLKLLAGRVPLLLEIKNVPEVGRELFLKQIADEMKDYQGEVTMQSFQPFYVRDFKRLRPDILCGLLATAQSEKSDFDGSALWRVKAHIVKHMSLNFLIKPDFISYNFSDLPTRKTKKFKGIKLAWTIRSEKDAAYALRYADNIIFENWLAPLKTVDENE